MLAFGIDRWSRELPTSLHPVGMIGRAAHLLRGRAPADPRGRLRYGMIAPAAVHAAAALVGFATERTARRVPTVLGVLMFRLV